MTTPDSTIYLDHAATSWPKPREVGEQILRVLNELTANAGRSGHRAALDSARMVFQTRSQLAGLLGVERSEDLIFVGGCTEGINLILKGWLKRGDRVLVSPMEHNAVMRPLAVLQRQRSLEIQTLAADPLGRIDLDAARTAVRGGDRPPNLVVVQHASNVNGVVQDLAALRQIFADVPMFVDAAQTAGVLPIDVDGLGIDFLAASVHKGLLGPTGVGLAYLAPERDVLPLIQGGTGSRSELTEQPDFRPDRYESGTLNLHGIAGTWGALARQKDRGLLGEEKRLLSTRLIDGLADIPGLRLCSPTDGTALCVSFCLEGYPPEEVALRLEREFGVLGRPGLHCAPAAHRHLGTLPAGTMRLAPGWGNTQADIDAAIEAVACIAGERR